MSIYLACESLECLSISHSSSCRDWLASPYQQFDQRSSLHRAQLKWTARTPQPCSFGSSTSLGSVGIRPCVVTFAADQFDMNKSGVAARSWNLFNWYYFSMGIAILTALTFVVYIQDNVGWGCGLGVPTIAMALSIIVFLVGSPLYNRIKPQGSPLVRLAQVIVAAVKKRKVVPEDPALLYENRELDAAISLYGRLLHTNQFK